MVWTHLCLRKRVYSLIKFFGVEGLYQAFGLSKPQILISTHSGEEKKAFGLGKPQILIFYTLWRGKKGLWTW